MLADGREVQRNREREAVRRRREAVALYTRFVWVEREREMAVRVELERLQGESEESEVLRRRIEGMHACIVPLASWHAWGMATLATVRDTLQLARHHA